MELFIILILTAMILPLSIMDIMVITKGKKPDIKILYVLFIYSFLVLLLSLSYINKPKAIDVYRGETTLEITYKNRVPVDSTVVWKNR